MPSVRERVAAINRNHGGNIAFLGRPPIGQGLPPAPPPIGLGLPPAPPPVARMPPPPPVNRQNVANNDNASVQDMQRQMKELREDHLAALRRLEQRIVALTRQVAGQSKNSQCDHDDGHTYERVNIEQWLENHDTSPLTNQRLANRNLIPNHALRGIITTHEPSQGVSKINVCSLSSI